MWLLAAVCSAVFAGITAILSKCGVKRANTDVATAIRTSVVLVFAWILVFATGAQRTICEIDGKSWLFLILSGIATGASWICYFKALSLGEVSKVAAVDKSSVVLSVLFAILLFPSERHRWQIKILCLAAIAVGVYLMTEIKRGDRGKSLRWFLFAALSAAFAAATSLLAKIGIENVNSNLATAIRTCVVLLTAWGIVAGRKEWKYVREIKGRELVFLFFSGVATGASWLCYYYAIQRGQVSVVVPIDKLSILLTIAFSRIVFREKLSKKAWCGAGILTLGVLCMALFT